MGASIDGVRSGDACTVAKVETGSISGESVSAACAAALAATSASAAMVAEVLLRSIDDLRRLTMAATLRGGPPARSMEVRRPASIEVRRTPWSMDPRPTMLLSIEARRPWSMELRFGPWSMEERLTAPMRSIELLRASPDARLPADVSIDPVRSPDARRAASKSMEDLRSPDARRVAMRSMEPLRSAESLRTATRSIELLRDPEWSTEPLLDPAKSIEPLLEPTDPRLVWSPVSDVLRGAATAVKTAAPCNISFDTWGSVSWAAIFLSSIESLRACRRASASARAERIVFFRSSIEDRRTPPARMPDETGMTIGTEGRRGGGWW